MRLRGRREGDVNIEKKKTNVSQRIKRKEKKTNFKKNWS